MVQKWIDYFKGRGFKSFQRAINRGFSYKPMIEGSLREAGLPEELFFLPLIESSYVAHAKSHALAVGIWQFMRGTGKNYGLKVNSYVDERKDTIRSSRAAVKYLKDLYTVFHSWELAMAAYNCGEHRVLRAIMEGDSRDYWVLVKKKLIPSETRHYVPKFMAAVTIGKNLGQFGFQDPSGLNIKKHPRVAFLAIPPAVELDDVAKILDISPQSLEKMNPHLRRGKTPPGSKKYRIWAPKGLSLNRVQYRKLHKNSRKSKSRRMLARSSKRYHLVKKGENLSSIAQRYSKSVTRLKRLNRLSSSRIYPEQRLSLGSSKKEETLMRYHKVSRGDNLTSIAKQYNKTVIQIKRFNGMASARIYPGQKLVISVPAGENIYYRVRHGDNLSTIAGRFGVSIAYIKRKNRLQTTRVYIGQKLEL